MGGMGKIPLATAMKYTSRFMAKIEPYVDKMEIAGSIRRQCEMIGDIDLVVTNKLTGGLETLFGDGQFPGMVMNGERLKRFKYPGNKLQIELHITSPEDYGRILCFKTGSSAFVHHVITVQYNRLGWCGTRDGLRRKKECNHKSKRWEIKPEYAANPTKPPVFDTEYDFFDFLGLKWTPPQYRNMKSREEAYNYST
jgi:DNA polymerase/3'-5' exonuclease PolX